jgi:adenylosuccinate lyase
MTEEKVLDQVSALPAEERVLREFQMRCISPDDAKYATASQRLVPYLSADAEWRACAHVQRVLFKTRVEFRQAEQRHLDELDAALPKINPLNMALLEERVTHHDQLAVLEEIGRFVSPETKALLHPGTTSYDILDTARSYLIKKAWYEVLRPEIAKSIEKLCELSEKSMDMLQVGRTHLQDTSPVLFGATLAGYAARLAGRLKRCDLFVDDLRGKVSGIVGTGASVDMVIGEGKSRDFEEAALAKLHLKADYTATQVVQKERLSDVGHGLVSLMHVLADFTNDMRLLYSSAIGEVTSRDNAARLGGSSADAMKNNPVEYENITGKATVVECGMRVLYEMIHSDLQRDLRGSVQARYQPAGMFVETYEAFLRLNNKALPNLSLNEDRIAANLLPVRNNPGEAMVAILRGEPSWMHPKYGLGHDFVKEMGKQVKRTGKTLLDVAMLDREFHDLFFRLPPHKQDILKGKLELYVGSSREKAEINRVYALEVARRV